MSLCSKCEFYKALKGQPVCKHPKRSKNRSHVLKFHKCKYFKERLFEFKKSVKGGYCPGCEKGSVDLWTVKDLKTGVTYWRCGVCKQSGKLDVVSLINLYKSRHKEA